MHRRRLAPLPALALLTVLAAACGGGGGTPGPGTASTAPPAAAPSAEAVRVDVRLNDALTIEPAEMTVPAGVPVTFVVANTGTVLHEFVVGDEEVQAEHEAEMAEGGGMHMDMDEPNAIGVDPGETKELTITFAEPASLLAGCHVAGHYAGGMKATITVE